MSILKGEFDNNEDLSAYGYIEGIDDEATDSTYGKLNMGESNEDLSAYGYVDGVGSEDTSDYIYGKLNKEIELQIYTGEKTDTANTEVDNVNKVIRTHVLKTPGTLTMTSGTEEYKFDGSEDVSVDISQIIPEDVATKAELQDAVETLETAFNQGISEEAQIRAENDATIQALTERNETLINQEIVERRASDVEIHNAIDVEIASRIASYNELNLALQAETAARIAADNALQASIDTKLDKANADTDILKDISVSVEGDSAYLTKTTTNLAQNTTNVGSATQVIPAATTVLSGLMTSSDVVEMQNLRQDVDLLKGTTVRLLYTTKANPTSQEIEQFVIDSGYPWDAETGNWYSIAVVVNATNHIWRYYENQPNWIDVGQDLVTQFTNSTAGVIKGSVLEGQIYAENDGTGSVNGWDNLKQDVSNNTTAIQGVAGDLATETTARQNADTTLQTNIDAKLTRVDGETTYDQAYVKTSAGTQSMSDISTSAIANTLVARNADGNFDVSAPSTDTNVATKKYVDDADALKVDKTSTISQVYATNSNGEQITLTYATDTTSDAIVKRDGTQINVPETPTQNSNATSKKYVDDGLASVVEQIPTKTSTLTNDGDGETFQLVEGFEEFTTTSDYIGYYVFVNGDYVEVTEDNKDALSIVPGETPAYELSPFATQEYVNLYGGKIDSISVNGTPQTIDANKNVDIDVPTALSDLTNDANFVQDANYVHTDNNYTTEEKTKLSGVESGAQTNIIETIKVNNSALTPSNKAVNIDLSAYSLINETGAMIVLEMDSGTFKIAAKLKDKNGNVISTSSPIDLPLESVVVSGSYDATNQKIILTLENGNTIDIPVGALISGLQAEITSQNKLDADLVDDSTSANKFVSATEKNTWNAKQDALSAGSNIDITNNVVSAKDVVTTNTAQTIEGKKTIKGRNLEFVQSGSSGGTNKLEVYNDNGYNAKIRMGGAENIRLMSNGTYFGTVVAPISANTDLGASGNKWRDGYIERNLTDGTNSITIADIANKAALAPAYDSTATYAVGDVVVYGKKLYICSTAVETAEAFDSTKWTEITIDSNYVDKTTAETITGKKTITDTDISFKNSNASGNASWQIEEDLYGQLAVSRTYNNIKSKMMEFNGNSIKPVGNNGNLGSVSQKWLDIYLSGKLKDGTNEIAVADIANKTDILLKPLTLLTTTMTDEQIATLRAYNCVLTNDLTLGTTSLKAGTILTVPFEYSNSLRGMAIYNNKIMTYYINLATKVIGDGAQDIVISNVADIKTGKVTIDNYTINKDNFGQLQIGNNNATSMQFDGGTVRAQNLVPIGNNSKDLGNSSQKWKDLHLAGSLTDGTNSISIADIVAKQDALPTTTTAGQVLKSTATSGTTQWGTLDASDVSALPSSTKYGASLDVSGTSVQLKDQDGNNLGSPIITQDTGATSVVVVPTYNAISDYATFTTVDEYVDYYIRVSEEYVLVTESNKNTLNITPGTTVAYESVGNVITTASYDSVNRKLVLTKGENFVRVADVDNALSTTSKNPVQNKVISELIPSQASSSNQLADKDFVNSSINAFAAYYITKNAQGEPFATKAELDNATTFYSGGQVRTPTKNDYCIVQADISQATSVSGYDSFTTTTQYVGYHILYNNISTLVTSSNKNSLDITPGTTICYYSIPTTRYTYQGNQWEFQYVVNDTSLTAAQIEAINSGITSTLVEQITQNQTDISGLQSGKLDNVSYDSTSKKLQKTIGSTTSDIVTFGSNAFSSTAIPTQASDIGAQPTLVSGTNIKTINNQSILGGGDLTIIAGVSDVEVNGTSVVSSGVASVTTEGTYNASTNKLTTKSYVEDNFVSVNEQTLTAEQKAQVKENLGISEGAIYTAGEGISISQNNEISVSPTTETTLGGVRAWKSGKTFYLATTNL